MTKERKNGDVVASGASGMGLMVMIAGHEREYQPKEDIKARVLQMITFLYGRYFANLISW